MVEWKPSFLPNPEQDEGYELIQKTRRFEEFEM